MIVNRALGGSFDLQVFGGILAIFTTFSAWMAVLNIKLKQIDQHRKWMMRCWVYAASIISLRYVQLFSNSNSAYLSMRRTNMYRLFADE